MRAIEAREIGECEAGNHLYFPGDLVYEIPDGDICESCFDMPYLAYSA